MTWAIGVIGEDVGRAGGATLSFVIAGLDPAIRSSFNG